MFLDENLSVLSKLFRIDVSQTNEALLISNLDLFKIVSELQSPTELGHEKKCLMSYANNKGADQPAHPRSLISALVVRCLDSIISLDSIAEILRL